MYVKSFVALAIAAGALAGCSGPANQNPVPAAVRNSESTRSSKPSTNYASGIVVDENGKPVVGALVVISPTAYTGSSLPPKETPPRSVTNGKGEFKVSGLLDAAKSTWSWKYVDQTIPNLPYPEWVEVFPRGVGRAPYHGFQTIRAGRPNDLGTIVLVVPTSDDIAEKAAMESDRATLGNPRVLTPLTFDTTDMLAARRWATYMATTGWLNHPCPPPHTGYKPCVSTWLWEIRQHGTPSGENIAYGDPNWAAAEQQFMVERFNCPGKNWKKCTWAENTGHYINIMDDQHWIGLGVAVSKTGDAYYDQEFGAPADQTGRSFAAYRSALLGHTDWR